MPVVAGLSTQRGSLTSQGHQGLRQVSKIFHKTPIVPDKANKLSNSFDLIRRMPVPHCRQLRGVTSQSRTVHNVSQEHNFRLHKCTFIRFSFSPKLLRRFNTSSSLTSASMIVPPNEITSSKYTKQRDHRMPHKTRSINLSNVAGALHNPNGITRNSPSFVTKAAFLFTSGDMATCHQSTVTDMRP